MLDVPLDDRVAVVGGARTLTCRDLATDSLGLRSAVPREGVAALVGRRAGLLASAVTALRGWAREVYLLGADTPPPEHAVILDDRWSAGRNSGPLKQLGDDAVDTRWLLYTSGTSGTPKPVAHDLASLARTVRPRGSRPHRWGLLFDPNRMAGVQVVLQSLAEGGVLLDATHLDSIAEQFAWLKEQGCTALSGTPTMWRRALQSDADPGADLRQITLGGEIADRFVLEALRRRFPRARITHVFASTETGAAFSVNDGLEGFPADYLTEPPRGIQLEIRGGILHVLSPGTSAAGADGFASTGDVVDTIDGRVLFRGRESGAVNVGGVKVWPEQVESTLRAHPAVVDGVVHGRRNALSGWILIASVVPADGADTGSLPTTLRSFCADRLSPAHVPAIVKVVDSVATARSGKAVRQ